MTHALAERLRRPGRVPPEMQREIADELDRLQYELVGVRTTLNLLRQVLQQADYAGVIHPHRGLGRSGME